MVTEKIVGFPLWEEGRKYEVSSLRRDILAALSVALMALPQAMAYAFVADLPTSAGIFAAIFGTIFSASFGASRFLVTGPTNTIAILLQSGTSEILATYYRGVEGLERDVIAMNIVIQLVLIVGIFQIIAGLLRMGRLTQFTSRSVIRGYMTGVAIALFVTQIFPFFGIRPMDGYHPIYQKAWYFITHIFAFHFPTLAIGLFALGLMIFLYRTSQKIPAAVIVFALAALASWAFNLSPDEAPGLFDVAEGGKIEKVTLIEDIGPVYTQLPFLSVPHFEFRILTKLVPLAFAITLISVLAATSLGRSFTTSKEPPYNDNQEIYGLGIANFACSLLGGMPVSGSFVRTTLSKTMGARTRFAAIFSGIILFLIVISFGQVVTLVPIAALSALMLFTSYNMLNMRELMLCFRATKADGFVVLVTLVSSTIFTLDVALYIGVILSIALYLKRAASPDLVEYAFNSAGKLRPMEAEDERPDPRIVIVQVEGELFFGAAELIQSKLRLIAEDESIRVIILQLMNARYADASVCIALTQVDRYMKNTNRYLILSGLGEGVWEVVEEAGIVKRLGIDKCFKGNEQLPSESTRAAYAAAKQLISQNHESHTV